MYFLTDFCRLCVTSDGKLQHIDGCDRDRVTYRAKLRTCTRMTFEVESWSAYICEKCIVKLRISYDFHMMCRRSTPILQRYLSELTTDSNTINGDLRISIAKVTPLQMPRMQRKYVSKGLRCSLLKELLSKIQDDKWKERSSATIKLEKKELKVRPEQKINDKGLKALINFTKSYNYGFKLNDDQVENVNFDPTPLEKLSDFVTGYFRINFSNFHDNLIAVLDESEQWSEESDFEKMLTIEPPEEMEFKLEEVIIPEIRIKQEIMEDEFDYNLGYPTSSNEKIMVENIKVEPDLPPHLYYPQEDLSTSTTNLKNLNQSSLELLKEFTVKFKKRRSFSPQNHWCRTRNLPFINPQLKDQFLNQDFSCNVCKRRFKSHGYLHAHRSKMKHWL